MHVRDIAARVNGQHQPHTVACLEHSLCICHFPTLSICKIHGIFSNEFVG
jgi:hypothetical protein